MPSIPINIADHVGRTPMVRLTRLPGPEAAAEVFAKLEMANPGGSVKDRIGVAMIEAAEAQGRIEPGRTTIVEATRSALKAAGVETFGRGLNFRDPWGNLIQVVEYAGIQFTKAPEVLRGMGLDGLAKTDAALAELRGKGLA